MLDHEVSENTAGRTMRGLPPISVERATCVDFAASSRREWLETNGTGGFAMGTVSGANTRRYHGLLVASLNPPVDRYVLLAKVDEEVLSTRQRVRASHAGEAHERTVGVEAVEAISLGLLPSDLVEEGLGSETLAQLVHEREGGLDLAVARELAHFHRSAGHQGR